MNPCRTAGDPARPPPAPTKSLLFWPGVVEELGQVDDVAALLPVQQEAEGEAVEVDVVGERHLEVRGASPTLPAIALPPASVPTLPKIWVAELPCSIWKVPSESANPPVWKVGTVSWVILLRLAKNVVRKTQFTSWLCTGDSVSDASTPRFRSVLSELKISVLLAAGRRQRLLQQQVRDVPLVER